MPTIGTSAAVASNPDYLFWIRQDSLLLGAIFASLSPEIYRHVQTAETSKEAWDKLAMTFARPSRPRLLRLRERLIRSWYPVPSLIISMMSKVQPTNSPLSIMVLVMMNSHYTSSMVFRLNSRTFLLHCVLVILQSLMKNFTRSSWNIQVILRDLNHNLRMPTLLLTWPIVLPLAHAPRPRRTTKFDLRVVTTTPGSPTSTTIIEANVNYVPNRGIPRVTVRFSNNSGHMHRLIQRTHLTHVHHRLKLFMPPLHQRKPMPPAPFSAHLLNSFPPLPGFFIPAHHTM